MFKRVWTPKEYAFHATESKIIIYDFGAFYGELVDDDWNCWEIISRTKVSGEIVEMLRACPQDWVPMGAATCQAYTGTVSNDTISIRGWSLKTTEIERESPVCEWNKSGPLKGHPQLLPRQPQQSQPPQQRPNPRPPQQTRPQIQPHVPQQQAQSRQQQTQSRQQQTQSPLQRKEQGHSPRHAPPREQPQSRQQQPPRQPQSRQQQPPQQLPQQPQSRQQQPQSRQQQPPRQPSQRPPPPSSEHSEPPQEGNKIAASPKILRGKTQTITNSSAPSSVQWTPLVQIAQQPLSPRR